MFVCICLVEFRFGQISPPCHLAKCAERKLHAAIDRFNEFCIVSISVVAGESFEGDHLRDSPASQGCLCNVSGRVQSFDTRRADTAAGAVQPFAA